MTEIKWNPMLKIPRNTNLNDSKTMNSDSFFEESNSSPQVERRIYNQTQSSDFSTSNFRHGIQNQSIINSSK